jgi:hypothetical protein
MPTTRIRRNVAAGSVARIMAAFGWFGFLLSQQQRQEHFVQR